MFRGPRPKGVEESRTSGMRAGSRRYLRQLRSSQHADWEGEALGKDGEKMIHDREETVKVLKDQRDFRFSNQRLWYTPSQ
jgi:hypothetical protein